MSNTRADVRSGPDRRTQTMMFNLLARSWITSRESTRCFVPLSLSVIEGNVTATNDCPESTPVRVITPGKITSYVYSFIVSDRTKCSRPFGTVRQNNSFC